MKFSLVKDHHKINMLSLKKFIILRWKFKTESDNQTENFKKLVSLN